VSSEVEKVSRKRNVFTDALW